MKSRRLITNALFIAALTIACRDKGEQRTIVEQPRPAPGDTAGKSRMQPGALSTVPREQSSKPARPAPELEEAVR